MRLALLVLVAAALATLLCCGVAAQTAEELDNTNRFLRQFVDTIPDLAYGWGKDTYCEFSTVTCDIETGLAEVRLTELPLTGSLPEVDAGIDMTKVLVSRIDISNQPGLTGTLPVGWGKLPYLRYLSISNTGFTGQLPCTYGTLSALSSAFFMETAFVGTLPPEWADMGMLASMIITDTNVQGPIPDQWMTGMVNLTTLTLRNNSLSGSMPNVTAMGKLRRLTLSDNKFEGSLLENLPEKKPTLTVFNLDGNNWCGCIPQTWLDSGVSFVRTAVTKLNASNPALVQAECETANACTAEKLAGDLTEFDNNCGAALSSSAASSQASGPSPVEPGNSYSSELLSSADSSANVPTRNPSDPPRGDGGASGSAPRLVAWFAVLAAVLLV